MISLAILYTVLITTHLKGEYSELEELGAGESELSRDWKMFSGEKHWRKANIELCPAYKNGK